jgi:hypothetical protein
MKTVNDVYTEVCDALCEPLPNGLSLGILTLAQFLDEFSEVMDDFCQHTNLDRKLINLDVSSGTASYTVPDNATHIQEAFFNDRYIHRATGESLDAQSYEWSGLSGTPRRWHEDRLPIKTIELSPTPDADGWTMDTSADFYGTLGSTTNPNVIDFLATDFYGTIASADGPIFIELTGPMYGTIGSLVASNGNLTLVSSVKPTKIAWVLADFIEVVPDEFVQYLKYGVLRNIFSRDAETKENPRARYCAARYEEGIALAKAVSMEAMEEN